MSQEQAETMETFDSFDESDAAMETFDDLGKDEVEESKPEKVKEDLKPIKDSKADVEGKVIKEDDSEEDEPKEKPKKKVEKKEEEESFDDEEVEEEEESEVKPVSDKKEEAPKTKLRMRMGDDLYNITSDASLPVKIDGKVENVSVQELVNNYSGKTAWDKKFTELGKEKKALDFEKSQVEHKNAELMKHVEAALAPIKDPSKNPLESLLYLVEMSNEDPYAAYRRIMEANLEELSTLMDMSEVERELYFHKKKDELHSKVTKQRNERITKEQTFNQVVEKVNALRQAYNVSEDEFVDASEELEALFTAQKLDPNTITEEQVVDFASLKPHIATVKELIEPYEDNIDEGKYGDVVAQLSRYLRDGKADKAGVAEILKRNFSVDEEVKELNTKLYSKQPKKAVKKVEEVDDSKLESFDDWN